jgi:hypothetical protein
MLSDQWVFLICTKKSRASLLQLHTYTPQFWKTRRRRGRGRRLRQLQLLPHCCSGLGRRTEWPYLMYDSTKISKLNFKNEHYQYFIIAKMLLWYNDIDIISYVCVFRLYHYDIGQCSETQFRIVELEMRTSTQLHIALWTSEFSSAFYIFCRTHNIESVSFPRANIHCVIHHIGSLGCWKGLSEMPLW